MRSATQFWYRIVAAALIVGSFCDAHLAHGQSTTPETIDFATHIKPILVAKCYECHSPSTLQGGGVRLDQAAQAKSGGYSQRPLLGGSLETNEIYRRITSTDPTYRMPKGKEPLSTEEIALIRRWVEAGTPWPDEKSAEAVPSNWFNRDAWLAWGERWLNEVPGFVVWLCVLLALQLGFLFSERYKRAVKEQKPWTTKTPARWLSPLKSVGAAHYLLIVTAMGLILSLLVIVGMQSQLRDLKAAAAATHPGGGGSIPLNTYTVYGNPPKPARPIHPRRLSGTYYRGNCERNAELFNGGNYRTATLRVSLTDQQGKSLNYGDRVEADRIWVRFELERAKGTTEQLFGDAIEKSVFLTSQPLTTMMAALKNPVARVHVVRPGWSWEAKYPIEIRPNEPNQTVSGLVYAYQGTAEEKQARGTYHFGIQYSIHLKDHIVQPDSELWMGSLFWSPALEPPNHNRIPMTQWFNHDPIPEITGKNSTNPKLLGIPEHLQKPASTKPSERK